jgi:hypothetical protein
VRSPLPPSRGWQKKGKKESKKRKVKKESQVRVERRNRSSFSFRAGLPSPSSLLVGLESKKNKEITKGSK